MTIIDFFINNHIAIWHHGVQKIDKIYQTT